jgi:phage terminase Nu1 subunit (DNA packaging protein)
MNLTPRRVQQLANDGMPKAKRGLYEEVPCLAWYCQFLQDKLKAGGAASGAGGPALSGRERLANAKADQQERANAKEAAALVAIADWERAMTEVIIPARHELLAIEARLRPTIGAEAAARVGSEIQRSLRSLGQPRSEVQ